MPRNRLGRLKAARSTACRAVRGHAMPVIAVYIAVVTGHVQFWLDAGKMQISSPSREFLAFNLIKKIPYCSRNPI